MDVSGAVERWVAQSPSEISQLGFAQIDLDDLLGEVPSAAVSVGLDCLRRIVDSFPPGSELDAMLTIPLEPDTRWELLPPALDDLLARDWSSGPGRLVPGLYIVHAMHWRLPEQVEEHKRPLISERLPPRFVAYYRAWRPEDEPEIDRCIYVRSRPA